MPRKEKQTRVEFKGSRFEGFDIKKFYLASFIFILFRIFDAHALARAHAHAHTHAGRQAGRQAGRERPVERSLSLKSSNLIQLAFVRAPQQREREREKDSALPEIQDIKRRVPY